jgi:hypothetical protein
MRNELIINKLRTMEVIPPGLEPGTCCLEGSCSIQLSYETNSGYML